MSLVERSVVSKVARVMAATAVATTMLPSTDSQAQPLNEESCILPSPTIKVEIGSELLFHNQRLAKVSWDTEPGVRVNYNRNDPATNWPEGQDKVINGVTGNSVQEPLRDESAQTVWLDAVKDGCVGSSASVNFQVTSPENNAPVEAVVFEKGPETPWRIYGPDVLVNCPTGTTHYQTTEEGQNPWGFPKEPASYPFASGKITYTDLYMDMEGRQNGVYKGEGNINCLDIDWQGHATWLSSMKRKYNIKVTDPASPDTTPVKDLVFNPPVTLVRSDAKDDFLVSKETFQVPCEPNSKYWQAKDGYGDYGLYQIAGALNPDKPTSVNYYTNTWRMDGSATGLAMIECLNDQKDVTSRVPVAYDIKLTSDPNSEEAKKVVPTIVLPKTVLDRAKVGSAGEITGDQEIPLICAPEERVLLWSRGSFRTVPGIEHSSPGVDLNSVYNWEHPQATRYSTRDRAKNGTHTTIDNFACMDQTGKTDLKATYVSQIELAGANPPKEIKAGQTLTETLRRRYERSGRVLARDLDFYCPTGTESISMDDAAYQQKREAHNLWGFQGLSGGHMDGFPVSPNIYLPSSLPDGVYKGTGIIKCYDANETPTTYQFPYELTFTD